MFGAFCRGGTTVTNTPQQGISRIRLGAAGAVLKLAVVLVLGVVATQSAQAQTFKVLYNFTGSPDGANPAGLVRDAAGNLYGTTNVGGTSDLGTVFKVSKTGKETVLHSFTGSPDGAYPVAELIRDTAGNLYGTTWKGGGSSGFGTVFKVSKTGKETVLYAFTGTPDGANPEAGLVRDMAGNLYGTTSVGGAFTYGTVFKVGTTGKETVLHSFAGGDGAIPAYTSLLMDTKGDLYGVTSEGGTPNKGVVYKLSTSGTLTLLHSFAGGTMDGCNPLGTPVMDTKGNVYGTTLECGSSGEGIVWKVSQTGTETVLHNFAGGSSDGQAPFAGVILDAKGNLYGDTYEGGASGQGTVYKLSKSGKLVVLHSLNEGTDGANPEGGVIRDAQGNLYGAAEVGGSDGYGTVWKLTP